MKPLLLALPGNEAWAAELGNCLDSEMGGLQLRQFPDGKSYVRLLSEVAGRAVVIVCALDRPDSKMIGLYLAAGIARELGATSVGLVIPYLPYMRQDARFKPGEGITSAHFARLLSSCCDWFVTVDPHLHRHLALDEIYTARNLVVRAAPLMSAWIAQNVTRPVIVGPDGESEQWAAEVAAGVGCPFTVLQKVRSGDREVSVSVPDTARWSGMTPVLVDDIVSTARTMIAAAAHLKAAGLAPPVCVAVHALFADDAYLALQAAQVGRIVTCNTVMHASNQIDLWPAIAVAIRELLVPE